MRVRRKKENSVSYLPPIAPQNNLKQCLRGLATPLSGPTFTLSLFQEKRREKTDNLLNEIIAKNVPNLGKDISIVL